MFDKQTNIPERPNNIMLQVWTHLHERRSFSTYCFLKAMELVRKYPDTYKLTFSYRLKELR